MKVFASLVSVWPLADSGVGLLWILDCISVGNNAPFSPLFAPWKFLLSFLGRFF